MPISRGNNQVADVQQDHLSCVLRRSTRERRMPIFFNDYDLGHKNCNIVECFFAGPYCDNESGSYEEAKYCPQWISAMEEKMAALLDS